MKHETPLILRISCAVLGFLLCFSLLLAAVLQTGCSRSFYEQQQERLNVAGHLNVTDAELRLLTDETIRFLQGKRADYDIRPNPDVPFFDEHEQSHMIDVQKLFTLGRTVMLVLFAVVITAGVLIALRRPDGLYLLVRGYRVGCGVLVLLLAALALFALLDWDAAFTFFHQALQFGEGEWLFPYGSPLIVFLPEGFFMAAGIRIAVQTAFCWLVFLAAGFFVRRPQNRFQEESL